MLRFAANLSMLFAELPYRERFRAAAEEGFEAVEVLFPYDHPVAETRRELVKHGLTFALMNAPPPNYAGGEPGFAAVPGAEARFMYDIRRVLRYADQLRPGVIHVMAGRAKGVDARAAFVANLRAAADRAQGQVFTIEPLNQLDQPGYFLSDYGLAAEVLQEVDRPNVGLQYDSYHAQMIHGDALQVWKEFGHLARHAQIGDTPGRRPPGEGQVDFPNLFAEIRSSAYEGWVSAEYKTGERPTAETLAWRDY